MIAAGTDPRRSEASETDIRPMVGRPASRAAPWAFGVAAVIAAILLFSVLDARRRALTAPPVRPRAADISAMPAQAPRLYVPPAPSIVPAEPLPASPLPAETDLPPRAREVPPPPPVYVPPPIPPASQQSFEPAVRPNGSPVLVIDTTGGAASMAGANESDGSSTAGTSFASPRIRASRLRNRSTTVPQGTLIPAALETALDSTRPGQARALVSRDVRGYDGSRILIPRGSRLFGEYRADLAPGQNRAFVQWTRLVRPDGATIAIGSPAADELGRAGIKGSVNSHFLARFGAVILQSTLDVGTSLLGARLGNSPVIIVPNASQTALQPLAASLQPQPTLKVRQGTRVTVFVAQDLDFTSVETRRQ